MKDIKKDVIEEPPQPRCPTDAEYVKLTQSLTNLYIVNKSLPPPVQDQGTADFLKRELAQFFGPSDPSGSAESAAEPRKMIDVDGKEYDETPQCKYSSCKPVVSASPASKWLRSIAKPNLSGKLSLGELTEERLCELLEGYAAAQPVANPPKVEKIAHIIHMECCPGPKGEICPCHIVAAGMAEGCKCKEDEETIAAILRSFTQVSQNEKDKE